MRKISPDDVGKFRKYLVETEKSEATIAKYIRDVNAFMKWCNNAVIEKETVLIYKRKLVESYAAASVNSVISALNSFFAYNEWYDLKIKSIKVQKQIFINKEKELTKEDYKALLNTAKEKNKRLYYLIQTICSTGIRISELRFITVDAVERKEAIVSCKGKIRIVILPSMLCKMLKEYIAQEKIKSGSVFVSKNGNPLDRSNVWSEMKNLCSDANVPKNKVYPHNFRHFFARTYYSTQKDIVRLADVLGHSNVNTTRVYTVESGEIHRQHIQKLGLLLC